MLCAKKIFIFEDEENTFSKFLISEVPKYDNTTHPLSMLVCEKCHPHFSRDKGMTFDFSFNYSERVAEFLNFFPQPPRK